MKKTILIVAMALTALVFVGAGVVYAQDETPPFGGHGMRDGQGPLHTFMVIEWAKKLDLNVNDINTRLASGETMYDIALSTRVTAEEFPALMEEVRGAALDAAVAANVITQEQADWMKSHGFGHGGMRGNRGNGNCDGTGPQGQAGSGGRGMINGGRGWRNQQTNP